MGPEETGRGSPGPAEAEEAEEVTVVSLRVGLRPSLLPAHSVALWDQNPENWQCVAPTSSRNGGGGDSAWLVLLQRIPEPKHVRAGKDLRPRQGKE